MGKKATLLTNRIRPLTSTAQEDGVSMHILKTFIAGAFLGAGAFGALTHAAWVSTTHMSTIVPALTVADLIESVGAVGAGLLATYIVSRENHRHLRKAR